MLHLKNIAAGLVCLTAFLPAGFSQLLTGAATACAVQDTGAQRIAVPFFSVLTDAINTAVSGRYDLRLKLVAYPAQGDLMWYYENPSGVFNQGTFDFISARACKGTVPYTAALSAPGGFPNAYSQVISSLYYNLSSADRQRLSNVTLAAREEAAQLVQSYESAFGSISGAQIDSAAAQYGPWISTKLDYIINVVAGSRWSGREAAGLPPLSYTDMTCAKDLSALLPDRPPNSSGTITALRAYLDKVHSVTALADSASNGSWTVRQLQNNTGRPGPGNGGMKTVDPNTGAVSAGYQPGYMVMNPLTGISNDLHNTDRTIRIVMQIRKTGPDLIRIRTAWNATEADTFSYLLPDSVYIDLFPLPYGQSDQVIEITYYGFSMITTQPYAWSDSSNTGWYDAYPLDQAIRNDTQDVTGYKLASWPPPYNMGAYEEGGTFGQITHLLICNYQQFSATLGYPGEALPALRGAAWPMPSASVPVLQQTAYVIGGAFSFPGSGP